MELGAEGLNQIIQTSEPVVAYLGFRIVELGEGWACGELPGGERAQRVGGILHGGVISLVLDETMGAAVLTVNDGVDQVTVELKINFLEPGVAGPFRVCGRVLRRGKTLVVAEGEVKDAEGRIVAKAIGTWYIKRASRPPQ
ncbi:MAG: PaaI family thioesterase [Pyrobaculum sp.]